MSAQAKGSEEHLYDLAVVGAGPAGLCGALQADLVGLDTVVLDRGTEGGVRESAGEPDPTGLELVGVSEIVQRFRDAVSASRHLGIATFEVTAVGKERDVFTLHTREGEGFRARSVLIATGAERRRLGVPGEMELTGRGVFAYGPASFQPFGGREVAVVGGGDPAVKVALDLAAQGARVTLLTQTYGASPHLRLQVATAPNISVLRHRDPLRIEGSSGVDAVVLRNLDTGAEELLHAKAVFVELGVVPNSAPVRDLVHLNHRHEVRVDGNGRTGLPGLCAAGDVTTSFGKGTLIAAGEGVKAALSVARLLGQRKDCRGRRRSKR